MAPREVVPISLVQARKMFSDLAESPFLVMCIIEGDLRVYTRGLDERATALVQKLIRLLEEEAADGQGQD